MSQIPEILRMAQDLAQHAGARQSEIARNVANADTPGYRAKDLVPFADVYERPAGQDVRTTRAGHAGPPSAGPTQGAVVDTRAEPSPNGNSVSIETEIMKSAQVRKDHDLALAVYRNSLDLMRAAIGRGR